MTLPADATIASIQKLLGSKEDYVAEAYGNVHAVRKAAHLAPVRVRLGRTGKGDSPHYRVEVLDGTGAVVGDPITYRGDNHKELFKDNFGLTEGNWSTETMSYDQLRDLLGEIRNFKKKV